MKPHTFALALLFALGLTSTARAQDDPPPFPVGGNGSASDSTGPVGLQPGKLPADAAPKAIQAWRDACAATLVEGAPRQPVTSFRLSFDLRFRPDGKKSHDLQATYSFKAPGYVRFTSGSGREHLRGPQGDFLINGNAKKPEDKAKRLSGRESNEDRKQIDDAVRIARNFVSLTNPSNLRIQTLELAKSPPPGLPKSLVRLAPELKWLTVDSPDFHLYRSEAKRTTNAPRMFRIELGLDPVTKRIELAMLSELTSRRTAPVLIQFTEIIEMDGFRIPKNMMIYEIDPRERPPMFRDKPTSDLVLLRGEGTLRANLKDADFLPPKKETAPK